MKTFNLHMMPPISYEVKHGGKNDRNLPMKYDGMVVVERNRDGRGNASRFVLAKSIMDKLHAFNEMDNPKQDEAVRRIPIRFLSDDIGENFNMYRAFFMKNTIACGAHANEDGGTAMRRFKKSNGVTEFVEPYEYNCNKDCPIWNSDNPKFSCDIYGSLHFVLDDSIHPHGSLCVHRINGRNAQRRIMSSLHMISKYTGGILANIPFCIAFHFENVPDHTGMLQKVPVMVIEPQGGYQKLRENILVEIENRRTLNIDRYINVLDKVVERSLVTEIEESSDWVGKIDDTENASEEISTGSNVGVADEIETIKFLLSEDHYIIFDKLPAGMKRIMMNKFFKNGELDVDGIEAQLDKQATKFVGKR